MPDPPSPCGTWRATVIRLGDQPVLSAGIGVLARVEEGGAVTVFVDGRASQPGIGVWRSAGHGRVLAVVEWLVDTSADPVRDRLCVHAAAELSDDGRTCLLRLHWQFRTPDGRSARGAATGEAEATRLEP
jgi:hypothetical protein